MVQLGPVNCDLANIKETGSLSNQSVSVELWTLDSGKVHLKEYEPHLFFLQEASQMYISEEDFSNNKRLYNNNNNKTCNAHVSTLLGVQGTVTVTSFE